MTALALLTELRRQGVKLIADGNKLRVMTPRGVGLPDTIKNEIRHRRGEILSRLRSGGITVEDVAAVFPGAEIVADNRSALESCRACGGRGWWVSRYGVKICARCHPPTNKSLVAEWISPPEIGEK